jgi:hypothetical protein
MKYICLIYANEKEWEALSKEQTDAIHAEYFAFGNDIKKSGQYLLGHALQPTQNASTVRVRQNKLSTTDGPFAETKEQLGGFYLIEAKDLNEAILVASRIPSARTGAIEVRPILELGG